MASTYFTYAPSTGNGNAQISVSANTTNVESADCVSHITFTAGTHNTSVTIRQKYCPIMNQVGSTTFPATGGTILFEVNTEYDIVFRSVPDWITIKSGNTTYTQGQRISSGAANGTFRLIAEANTGGQRTVSSTMNMGHYIGNTLQNYYSYFAFTQQSASTIVDMRTTPVSVAVGSASTSTTVNILTSGCSFSSMTYTTGGSFVATAATNGNQIIVTYPVNNTTTARTGYAYFTLYDTSGNSYESYLSINQEAGIPAATWTAVNTRLLNSINGNLMTGLSESYAGIYLAAGDTQPHTEAVPVTITSAMLGISPGTSKDTVTISNPRGQVMTCTYAHGIWTGTGAVEIRQGDTLTFSIT